MDNTDLTILKIKAEKIERLTKETGKELHIKITEITEKEKYKIEITHYTYPLENYTTSFETNYDYLKVFLDGLMFGLIPKP